MPITTNNPVIIPPTAETVCDRLWIESLTIDGSGLGQTPIAAHVVCRAYAEDAAGNAVFPLSNHRYILIEDVYAKAATTPAVAGAIQSIYAAVQVIVSQMETPEAEPQSSGGQDEIETISVIGGE